MEYLNAFWVGGLICALTQILMEKTKMLPGRIMVLLVCSGAVLGAIGICTASWVWEYALEGRQRSCRSKRAAWRLYGWLKVQRRRNLCRFSIRVSGKPGI